MNKNKMSPIKLEDEFSFQCTNCGACCNGIEIRLTPYDILKMSDYLQLSTMDFIDRYVLFRFKATAFINPCFKRCKTGIGVYLEKIIGVVFIQIVHLIVDYFLLLIKIAHKENQFFPKN
ncbi:hypothetical protein AZF37_04880 [endosymbiont 'TC1' of Trimyema compressum]|uniref:YkgJ family cysteine cluster protein n=1 Tax=endosymbiont 'TC1' of Trimyema compressum TaxID=243899 RepID=UPI0007F0A347|nr:YkgJ family cysteine cluster protein [endosymbiont 'TC1' of Trimyema compressum]AMP20594.1 hypothetical protein AZF37_04880 [endosymbiont 'TC1' of Trimyema compressum]